MLKKLHGRKLAVCLIGGAMYALFSAFGWQAEHGGALRLYLADGREDDVLPQAGTLALFLSSEMPHEVLPATRERLSLTGWFRRRGGAVL